MWWIWMCALAEESGTRLAPDYSAWDARLQAVLAEEGWHRAEARFDVLDAAVLLQQVEALDETALQPAENAVAWQRRTTEMELVVGSNLRVKRDAAGGVEAIAFGVTRTDDRGRMLQQTNDDVLITYRAGVPDTLYRVQVRSQLFQSWTKTLWTLQRGPGGALTGAVEVSADRDFHHTAKPMPDPPLTTRVSRKQLTL